jgi:hypothetical protein
VEITGGEERVMTQVMNLSHPGAHSDTQRQQITDANAPKRSRLRAKSLSKLPRAVLDDRPNRSRRGH